MKKIISLLLISIMFSCSAAKYLENVRYKDTDTKETHEFRSLKHYVLYYGFQGASDDLIYQKIAHSHLAGVDNLVIWVDTTITLTEKLKTAVDIETEIINLGPNKILIKDN